MIDAYVDLSLNKKVTFIHTLESIGMNELIISNHPDLKPSPTRTPGTKTIDGVFGTPALDVERGRYAPFIELLDHWLSWVDFQWESALDLFQIIQRHAAQRL